jgi:hypothetical protein
MAHNWYSVCPKCHKRLLKRDMQPLYTAKFSSLPPKILCYLCEDCFVEFLEEYGVSM